MNVNLPNRIKKLFFCKIDPLFPLSIKFGKRLNMITRSNRRILNELFCQCQCRFQCCQTLFLPLLQGVDLSSFLKKSQFLSHYTMNSGSKREQKMKRGHVMHDYQTATRLKLISMFETFSLKLLTK